MDDREINKYVGMKIKEFRKEKKLTQKELADLVGVKNSAISNYEQGTRIPKRDFLFRVANSLNISIDEFFPNQNGTVSSTLAEITKISSQLEQPRQQIVLDTANNQLIEQNNELENAEARERKILSLDSKPIDITKIPGYMPYESDKLGTAPILGDIAAGYNIMAEENFDGMIPVGPEYAGRDDIFWLNIRGQSMESLIHDGTLGLFEHSEDIHDGRIGAVMSENGDWITVKRIYHNYDENGYLLGLTLVPENEECDTIIINEYNPGRIIGRLLEVKQYF